MATNPSSAVSHPSFGRLVPCRAWRWLLPLLVASSRITAHAAEPGAAPGLRLGAARESINAPPGIGLSGYYHPRGNEGVLDDLQAKAMVLDDGTRRAALVVCDLIGMPRWLVDEVRAEVERRTGIPGAHVLLAATHTHTAPVLRRDSSRDVADQTDSPLAEAYGRRLPGLVAKAVADADAARRPVRLAVGRGSEAQLSHNRRWWLRDGSVGWNPGKLNPDLVRPAGPIDPEVGILHATAAGERGEPVLTFVNFATHPDTTGGTRLSADYPGALSRALALYQGPDALTLFANGTCGNLNHLNFRWGGPQTSPAEANRLGIILAGAVLRAWPELKPATNAASLRILSETVALPLAPFTPAELEQARLDVRTAKDSTRDGFMKLVRGQRILDVAAREGRPIDVEMQVVALGREMAWVAWPGEIFVELGLGVKAASPFPHTWNVELANGTIGYIPNKSAWPEGNYEVESSRVAMGAGEMLMSSALRLLRAAHEQAGR